MTVFTNRQLFPRKLHGRLLDDILDFDDRQGALFLLLNLLEFGVKVPYHLQWPIVQY